MFVQLKYKFLLMALEVCKQLDIQYQLNEEQAYQLKWSIKNTKMTKAAERT